MFYIKTLNTKLVRSAGIYTLTSIIEQAIPFFLLPILTRYLAPEDYGIVSMFGTLVTFITPFVGVNTHGAIARVYYDKDSVDVKEYIYNCLLILIMSTAIVSIVFIFFSSYIANLISLPAKVMWVAIVISIAQFISKIVLTLWQVEVKPGLFGVYQILKSLTNVAISLWLVVSMGLAWQGRIWGQLVAAVVFMLIGIIILWKNKWLSIKFNFDYIKHALAFGIPLIPHAVGGVILAMTDRVFITNMVGIGATGIYTVGYQIGMMISLLTASFNQAYIPWLYEQLKENKFAKKVKIVKFTYLYFIAVIVMAIGLALVAPWFMKYFIGKQFAGASIFVVWIALGYAFKGMYLMVGNYIFYAQKTSILAWVTFLAALMNIILIYIFIHAFGAIGAAQATAIVYLIKFILTWILSAKVFKMPWNLKNVKRA